MPQAPPPSPPSANLRWAYGDQNPVSDSLCLVNGCPGWCWLQASAIFGDLCVLLSQAKLERSSTEENSWGPSNEEIKRTIVTLPCAFFFIENDLPSLRGSNPPIANSRKDRAGSLLLLDVDDDNDDDDDDDDDDTNN
ncbi:hypothetical protein HZH68_010640 [Vespula germanica]|uniref:Uncharacterized protein n=1 Tax=Vespula germanica TaxID=30212 RepID=A0A834JUE1_VESGE|nr:hypothetical protein HZH68_010640 [Vespula germanica]